MNAKPKFLWAKNAEIWDSKNNTLYNQKEIIGNLFEINPARVNLIENSVGCALLGTLLFAIILVLWVEVQFIIENAKISAKSVPIIIFALVGGIPITSVFRYYLIGLRAYLGINKKQEFLLDLAKFGDRIIGYVEKIEQHSIITFHYLEDGEKYYGKYYASQVVVDKLRPMSRIAVLRYKNKCIVL